MTIRIEYVCLHGVLCRFQYYFFQLYHDVSCVSLPELRVSRICYANPALVSARIIFYLYKMIQIVVIYFTRHVEIPIWE